MLAGKLALHDLEDVEARCAYLIERSGLTLSYHEHEDLLEYLVSTCWELSLKYRPGGMSFSAHATYTLRLRVVDWQRQHKGRTKWQTNGGVYQRPRVQVLSLTDELARTLADSEVDASPDRSPDLMRAIRDGGSTDPWD